jgi:UDP-glucose 4-epimerase
MRSGTILVTGGAGYIGSHTLIELLNRNAVVISVDNFSNSSPAALDRIREITGKNVINHDIDLCDADAVAALFKNNPGITSIIHFAAFKSVPDSVADPERYYHNNNVSLKNLLDNCAGSAVRQFIFSSSCSVYGNISTLPVNETTPLGKAESPYAGTKQEGERMVKAFADKNKLIKLAALRYFNPVGAHPSGKNGESPVAPPQNLVPVITRTAIGKFRETVVFGNDYDTRDGTCIRDYVHVCDIADAHIMALDKLGEDPSGQNYFLLNLGTGKGVSVLEAIHAFEKVSGKKLNYRIGPRRQGDVSAIFSDCSLAEKILGWKPKYSIEDMMATAWKWELHSAGL